MVVENVPSVRESDETVLSCLQHAGSERRKSQKAGSKKGGEDYMIVGIGTDLIEIARIEKACRKQAFLSRIYTEEECRLAGGSISRLAGNFAVKEAVSKALGNRFPGVYAHRYRGAEE